MNTPSNPIGILVIVAILITLGYVASCGIYPYKACRTCGGRGQFVSRFFRAIRDCRRCGGAGRQLRAGRKAYNAWIRTRKHLRPDRDRRDQDGRR